MEPAGAGGAGAGALGLAHPALARAASTTGRPTLLRLALLVPCGGASRGTHGPPPGLGWLCPVLPFLALPTAHPAPACAAHLSAAGAQWPAPWRPWLPSPALQKLKASPHPCAGPGSTGHQLPACASHPGPAAPGGRRVIGRGRRAHVQAIPSAAQQVTSGDTVVTATSVGVLVLPGPGSSLCRDLWSQRHPWAQGPPGREGSSIPPGDQQPGPMSPLSSIGAGDGGAGWDTGCRVLGPRPSSGVRLGLHTAQPRAT